MDSSIANKTTIAEPGDKPSMPNENKSDKFKKMGRSRRSTMPNSLQKFASQNLDDQFWPSPNVVEKEVTGWMF